MAKTCLLSIWTKIRKNEKKKKISMIIINNGHYVDFQSLEGTGEIFTVRGSSLIGLAASLQISTGGSEV